MDILDINGSHIKKLREELKWSREYLCEKSGVPVGTLQDIENEVSNNPGLGNIKKLLKVLPNYVHVDHEKDRLILSIQTRLTALDYDELRTVMSSIDDLPGATATLKSKTTLTK